MISMTRPSKNHQNEIRALEAAEMWPQDETPAQQAPPDSLARPSEHSLENARWHMIVSPSEILTSMSPLPFLQALCVH